MHSALRSFDYAQDKLMPREPAPATDRKWIPAFAGMTKCGRERPELNNVSRATVDQRDSIHNARLIPPCIIGKNVSIENCTIGPNVTIGDNCKFKNLTMKDCTMWDIEETG